MTIKLGLICCLAYFFSSCENQMTRKEIVRTVDEKDFTNAGRELNLVQSEPMSFLIFPVKGCGSCSERVLKSISEQRQLTIDKINFIISGENEELTSLIKSTFGNPVVINDHQSLMVRYGIVSIYPLFVGQETNKRLKVIEIRTESYERNIDELFDELKQ